MITDSVSGLLPWFKLPWVVAVLRSKTDLVSAGQDGCGAGGCCRTQSLFREPQKYKNPLDSWVSAVSLCLKSLIRRLHGGERGIRTLDRVLAYTPLAGVRLQPLGQLSIGKDY